MTVAAQCMAWKGQQPDNYARCVLDEGHDAAHIWEGMVCDECDEKVDVMPHAVWCSHTPFDQRQRRY